MRLQLISDLHTEFYHTPLDPYPTALEFCRSIEIAPDVDFLVIAGDLVIPARQDLNLLTGILNHFSRLAKHVIYVEGNHEFYYGEQLRTLFTLRSVMPKNYTWLSNDAATLDGVHFYGGTMWFPDLDGLNWLFRDDFNDWELIENLRSWVYKENTAFTENAMKLVTRDTIVISHHLPHTNSAREYRDACNRFFVSDQTPLITEKVPRLWLHGHTHTAYDFTLGDTRVVCNPYGYPRERKWKRPYLPVILDV